MQKLDWLPLYVDKLLSSPAWQDMRDYQRGWYIQLLLRCTRSECLGYLRLDGNLWRIAGAHSKAMWDHHSAAVMACFKSQQIDGTEWIYNQRLLSTMEEQDTKFLRGRRMSGPGPLPSQPSDLHREKKEKGTTTPDLPALQLARKIVEQCQIPVCTPNLSIVAASIEAAARAQQLSIPEAYDWLETQCIAAIDLGEEINNFWFQDGKYNHVGKQKPSKQINRIARSYDAVDRAFSEDGQGDVDADERKVRKRTNASRGKLLEGDSRAPASRSD